MLAFFDFAHWIINWASTFLVFVAGVGLLVLFAMFFIDKTQTRHTIRRNYPILGRFRYFFEFVGEFFRQYIVANDREELPFNRAQRSWAYRAAKNIDNTVAFGSTKDKTHLGSMFFLHAAFPPLEWPDQQHNKILIGPYSKTPYTPNHYFNISGMSFGALSAPAVRALSHGAGKAGCWLNTGEGGLSSHHLIGECDVVFQIGTAKYGVRDDHGDLSEEKLKEIAKLDRVRMFEIKLSQGAKPGKGGMLPGDKVTSEIAHIRGIPKGKDSISPSRHVEVGSVYELLDFIHKVRDITGKPVGFKFAIGEVNWLDDLCEAIKERGVESAPDFITIDGGEGGTGAAPLPLIDDMGVSIKESLPMLVDTLRQHQLKDRIPVIASGKLTNPIQVAWAMAAGADFVNSARGFMFALGCVQALKCNKNTCPTGITTHDPKLQKGLVTSEKSVRVKHYHENLMKEVEMIAHSCGVAHPRLLNRSHVRILQDSGRSILLSEIYPEA